MLYFPAAMIIGLMQIADGISLLKTDGKPTRFSYFQSTTEFIWLIISIVAVFTLDVGGWAFLAPVMFISYMITGFFYASSFMSGMEEISELIIPRPYIFTVIGFGLIFFLVNAGVYFGYL